MRRLFLLAWAVPAFPLLAASCQRVEGASILARDFAAEVPAFAELPPATQILAAPVAGVQRVVSAPEVLRLLHKFNLDPPNPPAPACFEQATTPLTGSEVLPVLRQAFPVSGSGHEVEIEILDLVKTPVPAGKLQFTRSGMEPSGLWHGRVVYGAGRSMSVWARVRVQEERTWVEAVELLPAGKVIRADQLTLQTGLRSPLDAATAESLESVVGKKPLRVFAPGAVIRLPFLIEPPQVERGDKVAVQVIQGGALLQFDAEAESPGHIGDLVFLRNPENGHRFQAKVEGKGKAAIRK